MLDKAPDVVVVLVLASAIFFWGRGLRNANRSDLIAGPGILALLCLILLGTSSSSSVIARIGKLVAGFGIATLLLSAIARPGGPLARRNAIAIGAASIAIGLCLSIVL